MPSRQPKPEQIGPFRACDLARDYGFTARHWGRLAAAGRIPGARQPTGKRGHWLFDRRSFAVYAESAGLTKSVKPIELKARLPLRADHPDDLIYAIYSAGHIKFGVSSNVTRRSYHFDTASPAPIVLLATIVGSNDLELAIQRRFAAHRGKGEWFRLSADVRAFVVQMQQEGRGVHSIEEAERGFRFWLAGVLALSNGGCRL